MDSWMFQKNEARPIPSESRPAADGVVGRITLPRLAISALIVEGTSETSLRHAVGHIAETALPGEPGNVGLAGHRDSFFRGLRNVRRGDAIVLATTRGEFRYQVVGTRVVSPRDVEVLDPDPAGREILTLVTCYPFYFVGAAPNRFIVRAEKM
jgi:sortase A